MQIKVVKNFKSGNITSWVSPVFKDSWNTFEKNEGFIDFYSRGTKRPGSKRYVGELVSSLRNRGQNTVLFFLHIKFPTETMNLHSYI